MSFVHVDGRIYQYKCNKCNLSLHDGWGGYLYIEDKKGNRLGCPHPSEDRVIMEVLKESWKLSDKEIKESYETLVKAKVGFNHYCLCLDCFYQFEADLGKNPYEFFLKSFEDKTTLHYGDKDIRECPNCKSIIVKNTMELIGDSCPKCKEGLIEKVPTNLIS